MKVFPSTLPAVAGQRLSSTYNDLIEHRKAAPTPLSFRSPTGVLREGAGGEVP